MSGSHDQFAQLWERVEEDLEATAAEYREAGWDVMTLDVGDVTALPSGIEGGTDRIGLDALVPGDQFERLQELVADREFDEYETYRGQAGGAVFLVLAMLDTDGGTAVMLPLFYLTREAEPWMNAAREAGTTSTFVRPLDDSARVVFSHADPTDFFPVDGSDADGDSGIEDGDEPDD